MFYYKNKLNGSLLETVFLQDENDYELIDVKDHNYVPTQLDRIEFLLLQDKAEIQQEAIDNYTLELIESGAL